jgi:hypothetical protein
MTPEERRALRLKQIEGWRSSGLTPRAYCERELISCETLRRWRLKLGAESVAAAQLPAGSFIAVEVSPAISAQASRPRRTSDAELAESVEVVLTSGRRVRFVDGLDERGLARLIRLLEVLPC